ncbi:WAP four-disulfide core domain protein 2 isoform X1 [Octodon degus]|uniref:WAP four-disulfide core domain protein 2 isoform X1 n=1 Tax=Octodon degus TaxID=10160 RepID=A0A6P6EX56_OCTDE|nr:WAP four-disulfide core domain protein 2 isoform X1 [Octodon degus]
MHQLCFSAALFALLATLVATNQGHETTLSCPVSRPAFCLERSFMGPCRILLIRYYYNAHSGRCEAFGYGGCREKQNNFETKEECMRVCGQSSEVRAITEYARRKGSGKPGVCPQLPVDRNCTKIDKCQADGDCAENLKCCQGDCGRVCSPPNEKPGICPSVDLPQLGICEDQCQQDSQCNGVMKCCRNGCGKVSCVTPNFSAPPPLA